MGKLRLVIADSDELERAQLRNVFKEISGVEVVGEAADLGSVIAILESSSPDAVIIGDELPQGKDFVARSIHSLFPAVRVVELPATLRKISSKAGEQRAPNSFDHDALNKLITGSSVRGSS